MSKHSRSIHSAPRYTGTREAQADWPAPSRLFIMRASPTSRFSTRVTTSSPCSFQSTALRKLK